MNCVENLPVFAAVVLGGHAVGLSADPAFQTAARSVLFARFGQTAAHVASGSSNAVRVRFAFFVAQLGAMLYMAQRILYSSS